MNKLEELHSPHSKYWDCHNDEPLEENHALKSAEITTDVAIKFAEWRDRNIQELNYSETKTTKELFDYFIKNRYGK